MSNQKFGDFPYGDDQAAGTYAQYLRRHPRSEPVAKLTSEPQVQKSAPHWRRTTVFVLVGLVGLLAALGLVKAMVYAFTDHSRIVTVCDAGRDWWAESSDAYDFETTDGDFTIIHPDGADVEAGKVYEFRWFGNKPLTSFREMKDMAPTPCE